MKAYNEHSNYLASIKKKVILVFLNFCFFFNVMTRYNETFSKMLSMLHYFDHSLCNQYFLTIVINQIWQFANEIRNTLILFRGNIQNIEQHQSIAPNQ